MLDEARTEYSRAKRGEIHAIYGKAYSFNLSCFLGDETRALEESFQLSTLTNGDTEPILQARDVLRDWASTRGVAELVNARSVFEKMSHRVSPAALTLSEAFAP
jgi:hypothetical protein